MFSYHFSSKFPPCIGAPTLTSALSEELNAAALVPMDAVLLQLLPLQSFAEIVLQKDLRKFKSQLKKPNRHVGTIAKHVPNMDMVCS